ncbi:hypothetical protein EYS09_22215 [Streptomyces kasugaensis]|uniref:DUF4352 domain-containing protein n=1 Tax=Streptomyces kasugaensis TaxID=1946 RepID=A0A4Q9HSU1_STRKA|nr:hypothetical protein [Streptomyces kasugaensis]TBO57529.1 hypothetical protein EYS09_22215 [Streptomyces kasugaensis]
MRRIALTLAATAVAGLLAGCSGVDQAGKGDVAVKSTASAKSNGGAAGGDGAKSYAADVKITKSGVEDHKVWGPHSYVVHYEITNHGPAAANYFAEIEFLDRDGDVLGKTGITADKLGPGKTKRADIAPVEAEIENGKPADIRSARVSQVART